MMTNNIKMMNDMELDNVTGGGRLLGISHSVDDQRNKDDGPGLFDEVCNAVSSAYDTVSEPISTAWEVVKYAFELCG